MTQKLWTEVDRYFEDFLIPPDLTLNKTLEINNQSGLPPHDVSPAQGKLLYLLAKTKGVSRILEIGTLGGYSTIWLAKALPTNGVLVTLESNTKHAQVARTNITNAGLADFVQLLCGEALDSLSLLVKQGCEPFDLIFIDADKPNNPKYLSWALKLSQKGSLIIADNVVQNGAVVDRDSKDEKVEGIRHFTELLATEPSIDATAIQTVGSKGYDGFVIALVSK